MSGAQINPKTQFIQNLNYSVEKFRKKVNNRCKNGGINYENQNPPTFPGMLNQNP